jgi:hypothetical protein
MNQHPAHRRARKERRVAEGLTEQQQLAAVIEGLFVGRHRTLSDPATAEAYLITLEAVTMMVDAAHGQGVVGESEHRALRAHLEGMAAAPGVL